MKEIIERKLKDSLDYDFEYEYIEERHGYWYKTYIWGLDKDIPYTIEDIENILINGDLDELLRMLGEIDVED